MKDILKLLIAFLAYTIVVHILVVFVSLSWYPVWLWHPVERAGFLLLAVPGTFFFHVLLENTETRLKE